MNMGKYIDGQDCIYYWKLLNGKLLMDFFSLASDLSICQDLYIHSYNMLQIHTYHSYAFKSVYCITKEHSQRGT